jgi:hypothetical protein
MSTAAERAEDALNKLLDFMEEHPELRAGQSLEQFQVEREQLLWERSMIRLGRRDPDEAWLQCMTCEIWNAERWITRKLEIAEMLHGMLSRTTAILPRGLQVP